MSKGYIAVLAAVLLGALQIVLIMAKLTGHIHASWMLVMTPVWAPTAAAVVLAIVAIALLARASSRGENPFQ